MSIRIDFNAFTSRGNVESAPGLSGPALKLVAPSAVSFGLADQGLMSAKVTLRYAVLGDAALVVAASFGEHLARVARVPDGRWLVDTAPDEDGPIEIAQDDFAPSLIPVWRTVELSTTTQAYDSLKIDGRTRTPELERVVEIGVAAEELTIDLTLGDVSVPAGWAASAWNALTPTEWKTATDAGKVTLVGPDSRQVERWSVAAPLAVASHVQPYWTVTVSAEGVGVVLLDEVTVG